MTLLVQQSLFAGRAEPSAGSQPCRDDSPWWLPVWRQAESRAESGDLDGAMGLFGRLSTAALASLADEMDLFPCNSGRGRNASLVRVRNHMVGRTPDAVARRAALDRWGVVLHRATVILRCARHAVTGGMWPWADAGALDRDHVAFSGEGPPTFEELSAGWDFERAERELVAICEEIARDYPRQAATHYLASKIREEVARGFDGTGPISSRERFAKGLHWEDSIAQDRSVQAIADQMWREHTEITPEDM